MMIKRMLLSTVLGAILVNASFAQNEQFQDNPWSSQAEALNQIKQNLQNLGNYLGFDLTQTMPSPQATTNLKDYLISYNFMYPPGSSNVFPYAYYTSSAIMAAAAATSLNPLATYFAPYSNFLLNNYTGQNSVFGSIPYNAQSGSKVTVNSLVDQQGKYGYQTDPTSQAIQNIFTTPDVSLCETFDEDSGQVTAYTGNCSNVKSQFEVMMNAIGVTDLPNYVNSRQPLSTIFSGNSNASQPYFSKFMPQLNANNLLSPLMYQTGSGESSGSSGTASNQSKTGPLTATTQAQLAQNYVRFATGQILPMSLPDNDILQTIGQQMTSSDALTQQKAYASWAKYMAGLTTYAAQMSVAYSNLNGMMAKRMPVKVSPNDLPKGQNDQPMQGLGNISQALYEFQMATWRLSDSTQQTDPAWLNKVVNSSDASIAKEQLALLAEINYQLYMNRQMQEKILLTNTMMLMQSMQMNRSMISLTSNPSSTSATSLSNTSS